MTAVSAQMKEQEREIHSLEEQLRTRTNECSELVAYKGSTEKLIKTFAERLDEVGKSVAQLQQSERGCKEIEASVTRSHDELCARLEKCRLSQQQTATCSELRRKVQALHGQAREAQQRGRQLQQALHTAEGDLARAKEEAARGAAMLGEAQEKAKRLHDEITSKDAQLAGQCDRINTVMQRNLKLSEGNDGAKRACLVHTGIWRCARVATPG